MFSRRLHAISRPYLCSAQVGEVLLILILVGDDFDKTFAEKVNTATVISNALVLFLGHT